MKITLQILLFSTAAYIVSAEEMKFSYQLGP